jgi:hypothetical protein
MVENSEAVFPLPPQTNRESLDFTRKFPDWELPKLEILARNETIFSLSLFSHD